MAGAGIRKRGLATKILLSMLAVGLAGVAAGVGTYAAFTGQESNPANTVATGTVRMSDDDAGSALFSLTGMKPSDAPVTRCVRVTYDGSLDSSVRLYATTSGALAQYLNLTITRGTGASFPSCTSFDADATDYIGQGAGVVYSGTLSGFPGSYGTGLIDPTSGSPETWTTAEVHAYRFTVSVQNDTAAQGTSATADFTWEARNL